MRPGPRRQKVVLWLRAEGGAVRGGLLLLQGLLLLSVLGCRGERWGRADLAELAGALPAPSLQPVASRPAASSSMRIDGPHPLPEYVSLALANNPEVQAARQEVEARVSEVTVAVSLPDPNLTTVAQPAPVQTAAGEFQFILNANQKFPAMGKLDARGAVANAEANTARAALSAVTLATAVSVKKVYYELYYVERALEVTTAEQALLDQLRAIADTRYQTSQASQQDVLRADLEISATENALIDLRQRRIAEQARLARLLYVAPESQIETEPTLSPQALTEDLATLQQRAVEARPELREALNRLTRDRRAVDLAKLDYRPDVTLGFAWIDVADAGLAPSSNGQDAVLLTAGMNLPLYRRRLDAQVRSVEAGALASARRYDALKSATFEEVTSLVSTARSRQEMLHLFDTDILPKARQTLDASIEAYNVGEVDFLQLLDNWRQVLNYELGRHRLEADLRQALAALEQAVGGWSFAVLEEVPAEAAVAPEPSGDVRPAAEDALREIDPAPLPPPGEPLERAPDSAG